jgi:predicted  nucleic acid-binding Zn-ribbon protein
MSRDKRELEHNIKLLEDSKRKLEDNIKPLEHSKRQLEHNIKPLEYSKRQWEGGNPDLRNNHCLRRAATPRRAVASQHLRCGRHRLEKSFQLEAEGKPGCNVRTLPVPNK